MNNFISNRKTVSNIISGLEYDFKAKDRYNNTFSSWRINDKLADIDFMEYQETEKLFIFMVISCKKKPKILHYEDFFKI